jgi:hypothetical protein
MRRQLFAAFMGFAAGSLGVIAIGAPSAHPEPAIAATIGSAHLTTLGDVNDAERVTIGGNIRPEVATARDLGRVADDFKLDGMQILLKRSPEREAALKIIMDGQTEKGSPYYHQWIDAAEMEAKYGADKHDVAVVSAWLKSHGITVKAYLPTLVLSVDATAGQLNSAFGVEIHNIVAADGKTHFANVNEYSVPVALAQVMVGPVNLNDFKPHTMMHQVAKRSLPDPVTHQYTLSGGYELVAPADLQTIYTLNPVYAEGYTGTGETIGLIEDTNLYSLADWSAFRKVFGLSRPYPHATLTQINPTGAAGCTNPGVNSADGEAALDVEWASAAAPNATIKLYSCADTSTVFGGFIVTRASSASAIARVNPNPVILKTCFSSRFIRNSLPLEPACSSPPATPSASRMTAAPPTPPTACPSAAGPARSTTFRSAAPISPIRIREPYPTTGPTRTRRISPARCPTSRKSRGIRRVRTRSSSPRITQSSRSPRPSGLGPSRARH